MAYQEAQNLQCSRILKTNTTLPEVTFSIPKVARFGLKVPLFNVIFFAFSGGANNPFLQEDTTQQYSYTADGKRIEGNQDQYYGAGYSQAQSGYSSSGFGNSKLNKFSLNFCILKVNFDLFQVFNKTSQTFKGVDEHFCCQAYYETYPKIGKRQKWS